MSESVGTVCCLAPFKQPHDRFVSEEDDGRVGDNSSEMGSHASIQSPHPFLCPYHSQSLQKAVVSSLCSGHVLSESCPTHL